MSFIFDDDRRGLALFTSNPKGTGLFLVPDVVAHSLCGRATRHRVLLTGTKNRSRRGGILCVNRPSDHTI